MDSKAGQPDSVHHTSVRAAAVSAEAGVSMCYAGCHNQVPLSAD